MVQVNIKNLIDEAQCYQTVHALRWPEGTAMDRKIKSPFARRTRVSQRLPQAATARWMQGGKTDRGALGRDSTHAEVCNSRHGAHVADEPTPVVVGLSDPVTECLAGTGRRTGGWVCSEFRWRRILRMTSPCVMTAMSRSTPR